MEQWEIDLRTKLEETLEDGLYSCGVGCIGGKGFYIDVQIAIEKLVRKNIDKLITKNLKNIPLNNLYLNPKFKIE